MSNGRLGKSSLKTAVATDSLGALGRALLLVGDKWSMLIIREIFSGTYRFGELKTRLALSDPVLSQRLTDLVEFDVLKTRLYQDRPERFEYRLTERGHDLWRVFVAIWSWEVRWSISNRSGRSRLIHDACGQPSTPLFGCRDCRAFDIDHLQTTATRKPGSSFATTNPPRHYRRSSGLRTKEGAVLRADVLELLGDRWSVSVLGCGMLGIQRFGEMQRELGISPALLTERLKAFIADDVMTQRPVGEGQRRKSYHLRPKGLDIMPVFVTTNAWANRWTPDPGGPDLTIRHSMCGAELDPIWVCNRCGDQLERKTFHFVRTTGRGRIKPSNSHFEI